MSDVIFLNQDIVEVGQEWLEKLKDEAARSKNKRARLCLHKTHEDAVQEMVIVFCRNSLVRPHRHTNKSESFHIIEGNLIVILFNDEGKVTQHIEMGAPQSGKTCLYRIASSVWHTVIPLSDFVAVHEVAAGPFAKDTNNFPDWASENEEQLKAFLGEIKATLRTDTNKP